MRSSMRWLVALFLVLCLPALLPAEAKKSKDKDKDKEDEASWEVSNPPDAEWKTIAIDTDETTWSEVDVSPDGSTIVFDMLGDLYTVPMEGGEASALTAGVEWNFQPRFSPDGSKIAFVSDRGGADNIWVMDADGSNPRAVSEEKEHLVHNPAWSNDGQYIAAKKGFTSTRSIPAGEIWLFHVGGGGGLQLTERPFKEKDQKTMAEPAFSADDRYVYYSQDTTSGRVWAYNKDSTGQIFTIRRLDRETGEIDTYVSGAGGAIRPMPSPDGKRLAFVRRTPAMTSAIYVKDLASGQEMPIYLELDRDLQETSGSQGNSPSFAWTPDGESLVFWAGGKIRRIDLESLESSVIPIHVHAKKKIQNALRFPVEVAPDTLDVKMIRWAQNSPDGSKIIFQALGHLYLRDAHTGEQRRLTSHTDHFEFYPSFSRDGQQIVYTTWDDQTLGTIRIIPTKGGTSRVISREPGIYTAPRFGPDGRKLVYSKLSGGYMLSGQWSMEPGIYVQGIDDGEPTRVSKSGGNAHFGADPGRVYFTAGVDETKLALHSVNLQGHDKRTHLTGATVREFMVSPDSQWVAFAEQFNAYVAPLAATGKTIDVGPAMTSLPVKQLSKRSGENLHWSADSSTLSWAHGRTLFTRELKDAFSFFEGSPEELPEPVAEGLDLGFTTDADVPQGRIALKGARLVTMRDAASTQEVIERGTIVVNGSRIEAIGAEADVTIPADAKVFDLSGKTIIPGLVDVHAHGAMARNEITPQQNWQQFSNLSFGVTTVHDPSNDTSSIFAAAEMQRAGMILGPRIFSTGTILYGAHAPGYFAKINSLEDAKFHVQRLKDVGAISVKSYQQPRRDQRQQVIAAGRELGIMVVPEGGAKFQHNMNEIIDGHTGIEHAISLARAYDDVTQLWSQSDTGYTPTFGVAYGGLSGEAYWYDRTNVWENPRLMRFSPRFIIEPNSIRRSKAPDHHYNHIAVATYAKELSEAGVSVQIGGHGQREGLAAHWEMWMMEQGGFSPWEAMRGATIDGARYVGLDGDVGSLEVGKLADLVVIDGNPLTEMRRSEFVTYTMLGGRLFEAATMNQVAPDATNREPFFFELDGGDTVHPTTQKWIDDFKLMHGWVH